MKLKIFRCILFLPILIDGSCDVLKPKLIKSYTLTAKNDAFVKTNDNQLHATVTVTLTNNSKETLNYVLMSCPLNWEYSIDSKMIEREESLPGCNGTLPKILNIPPHQNKETKILVKVKKNYEGSIISYRIKFDLYDNPKEFIKNYMFFLNNSARKNNVPKILWSNEVVVNYK